MIDQIYNENKEEFDKCFDRYVEEIGLKRFNDKDVLRNVCESFMRIGLEKGLSENGLRVKVSGSDVYKAVSNYMKNELKVQHKVESLAKNMIDSELDRHDWDLKTLVDIAVKDVVEAKVAKLMTSEMKKLLKKNIDEKVGRALEAFKELM